MRNLTRIQFVCVVLMAILGASYAGAFDTSVYATQSRLATGKWVKVTIPENGVYEITYDELREMGFNNPGQVHVYGQGGARINEVLNEVLILLGMTAALLTLALSKFNKRLE